MTTTPELKNRIQDRFERAVDAVDDLGWDPNGNDPVTLPMKSGTLVEVPPGTYRVNATQKGSPTGWGLRGTGDSPEEVRFVGPGHALRVLQLGRGSRDVLVENVAFDHGSTIKGCLGNAFLVEDGLLLDDVHYLGTTPNENTGATTLLPFYVFEPDGVAILDGVEMLGPSELIKYPANPMAIFSGKEHVGTAYIRNCQIANRGEHAIYASRCEGDIRVENSWFMNNQNTQVRISGAGSYAKDCVFVTDIDGHPNIGNFQATTGLTFEAGFQGFAGGLVEGCEFVVPSSANNSGCLKIDGSHGSVTVRDCVFRVDDDVTPILVQAPGDSHMITGLPDEPWPVVFDNVHVTHVGKPDFWGSGAVCIDGRDRSMFTDCCVRADGRDALFATNGTYDVVGGSLEATGARSRIGGTGLVRQENVGTTSDCVTDITKLGQDTDTGGPAGSGDDGTEDEPMKEYAHALLVKGTEGTTVYEVDVSGEAGLVTVGDYKANPGEGALDDGVFGDPGGPTTIRGAVAGRGGDSYTFDGVITDVRILEGVDPSVVVDGQRIDLEQFRKPAEPDQPVEEPPDVDVPLDPPDDIEPEPEPPIEDEPSTGRTVVIESEGDVTISVDGKVWEVE